MTKEQFLDECRRVAAEMNAKRKAEGSTAELTSGDYAEVRASAWATVWQAIEDKRNNTPVMRVVAAAAGKTTHAQIAAVALAHLGGLRCLSSIKLTKADKVCSGTGGFIARSGGRVDARARPSAEGDCGQAETRQRPCGDVPAE
jgi:hypothetical protein